jgi:hypothetical protein
VFFFILFSFPFLSFFFLFLSSPRKSNRFDKVRKEDDKSSFFKSSLAENKKVKLGENEQETKSKKKKKSTRGATALSCSPLRSFRRPNRRRSL